jgi:hypothetical protein
MNFIKALNVIFFIFMISCKTSHKNNVLDNQSALTIDDFFKKVEAGEHKLALQNLLSQNEDIVLKDSATINLIGKFNYVNEMSGKYIGNQLLKKRLINSDIAMYSYLVKYERKFYRFLFEFYNNGNGGKIYKFKFDDNLDLEMEESIKLYTTN